MARSTMKVLNDDIVGEIIVRLPDSRSIRRSAAVCKRWLSVISDPQLKKRHQKLQRQQQQQLSFTIMFRDFPWSLYMFVGKDEEEQPSRGRLSNNFLDFLPPSPKGSRFRIRSLCRDLLLVETGGFDGLCVVNPLTRKSVLLPPPPADPDLQDPAFSKFCYILGLVCSDDDDSFTVVLFMLYRRHLRARTFRSVSGRWDDAVASFPAVAEESRDSLQGWTTGLAADGFIYWRMTDCFNNVLRIAAFSPEKQSIASFALPSPGRFKARFVRIAAVQGRLRLLKFHKDIRRPCHSGPPYYVLGVWELSHSGGGWVLVHDVRVNFQEPPLSTSGLVVAAALHPSDGDAVFLADTELPGIWLYNIRQNRCEKISDCKMPHTWTSMFVHTLVHPPWPTQIRLPPPAPSCAL